MAKDTTHVRISARVKQKLLALADLWSEGDLAQDWSPAPSKMHVSAERVIEELIRRDAAHRLAAFRQRGRRRKANAARAAAVAEGDPAGRVVILRDAPQEDGK